MNLLFLKIFLRKLVVSLSKCYSTRREKLIHLETKQRKSKEKNIYSIFKIRVTKVFLEKSLK